MFGIKGKVGSPKENVFKVLGLNHGQVREDIISPYTPANRNLEQPKSINLQAYMSAHQRMHEIETQKAMVILVSRHECWKAGGPY